MPGQNLADRSLSGLQPDKKRKVSPSIHYLDPFLTFFVNFCLDKNR